jgi:hypothetical protein
MNRGDHIRASGFPQLLQMITGISDWAAKTSAGLLILHGAVISTLPTLEGWMIRDSDSASIRKHLFRTLK